MAEGAEQQQNQASLTSTVPEPASSSEPASSKKRFSLREALNDVRLLMEGESTSAEEKCSTLHRHYQTLVRDYKRLEKRLVECQRKQLEVTQHRDIIQTEYARVNLAKSKLESLCRELQRHNKAVAEESRQYQREEEERRREVSTKFQATINDISVKMQEHHQKNQALRQENLELATKLKQVTEENDLRESQYEKLLKHKQLEIQLLEAKMAQQSVSAAEDMESSLTEKRMLLKETLEQQKRCELLTQQEADLRGQLSLYSDKFEEFQKTLTKSNQVFVTFKKEMDKMSKTITSLEKETLMWKGRYEKSNKSLLEMAQERMIVEQNAQLLRSKNEKLEKLCRALQAERNQLRKQDKPQQQTEGEREEHRKKDKPSKMAASREERDEGEQEGTVDTTREDGTEVGGVSEDGALHTDQSEGVAQVAVENGKENSEEQ